MSTNAPSMSTNSSTCNCVRMRVQLYTDSQHKSISYLYQSPCPQIRPFVNNPSTHVFDSAPMKRVTSVPIKLYSFMHVGLLSSTNASLLYAGYFSHYPYKTHPFSYTCNTVYSYQENKMSRQPSVIPVWYEFIFLFNSKFLMFLILPVS